MKEVPANRSRSRRSVLVGLLILAAPVSAQLASSPPQAPAVPRIWTEEGIASFEVPLADPAASPVHPAPELFYALPERPIFKGYPVYHPDKEPPGYMEWLAGQEPELLLRDASALATEADWIRAGEQVFDAPITVDALIQSSHLHDRSWYEKFGVPVAADGTVPFFNYIVRKKGKVEVGQFSCATCHVKVLPDGTSVKGAPSNFPINRLDADDIEQSVAFMGGDAKAYMGRFGPRFQVLYGAPWLPAYRQERYEEIPAEEMVALYAAIPVGVQPRFGTSLRYPVVIPDLIGLEDRRFFDRTGHTRHRDELDLARYAVTQQDVGFFARYGTWIPAGALPDPAKTKRNRYTDVQLIALARYLYSLQPPPNPNPFDERAKRGQQVFEHEACARCHEPPLYTNNKLIPVDGFHVPDDSPLAGSIERLPVGTDPRLALHTRRGTGFYKVPSLKGLWYRGPFEHSGSVATLEDWFDPRRLRDDYVPTGFRGAGVTTRAVRGHPFGLDLSPEDREALIAFLRTL